MNPTAADNCPRTITARERADIATMWCPDCTDLTSHCDTCGGTGVVVCP